MLFWDSAGIPPADVFLQSPEKYDKKIMCSLYRLFVQSLISGLSDPDSGRYIRVQKTIFARKLSISGDSELQKKGISYAEQLHYNWFCFLRKKDDC